MKNKKSLKLVVVMIVMLSLLVISVSTALAWKEGSNPLYYLDASYGGYHNSVPLVIKLNGNSSSGQKFNVGETITISCDLHAYAKICDDVEYLNSTFTEADLDVDGPSGHENYHVVGSDSGHYDCAEVDTIDTLTISYDLTTVGNHSVWIFSGALVHQEFTGFHIQDIVGDSLTFEVIEPFLNVNIDIKPGSDPNCFNSDGHGVIPVVILGSADFDAATVDPFTVFLDGAEVRVKGKSGNAGSLEDVNGDGFLDLVIQIMDRDSYSSRDTMATLTGETFDGVPIEGTDSICIRPPE